MALVPQPHSKGGLVDADDPLFHLTPYRGGWIVVQSGEHIGHVKKLKRGWVVSPPWATGRQKQLLDRACQLLDASGHLEEQRMAPHRHDTSRRMMSPRTVDEPMEVTIPTMDWEQVDGDIDPGAYGATIARADGNYIELLKIQPVREYVGDDEAREVGFPFWTREASYDASDLDPSNDDVKGALQYIGLDEGGLRDLTPTQRALTIATALLDYGHGAEEGPSGWSEDVIHQPVKWQSGEVAGAEYLADEDDAFRNEVLGYDDIRTALEEMVERMADQSGAQAWSTLGDQILDDLSEAGFDAESAVAVAGFGDEVAVNGEIETEKSLAGVESELESEGYELTELGGRIPSYEAGVSAEHVVRAVAKNLGRSEEDVEAAAKGLDWWGDTVTWSTSGDGSVWAKRKGGAAEPRRARGMQEQGRVGPMPGWDHPAPKWATRIVITKGDDLWTAVVYDKDGRARSRSSDRNRAYVEKWADTYFSGVPVEYAGSRGGKVGEASRRSARSNSPFAPATHSRPRTFPRRRR